jgi:hypothetical protein
MHTYSLNNFDEIFCIRIYVYICMQYNMYDYDYDYVYDYVHVYVDVYVNVYVYV